MKLNQLASKPQLIQLTVDSEAIIKEYGEPLEFYTYDRQPLSTFVKFASGGADTNAGSMIEVLRTLILDENGKQILTGDITLPTHVLLECMNKITDQLGK